MGKEPTMKTPESQFQQVDRKSPEIMAALAEAPVYKKQGQVEARPATVGEEITTIAPGGTKETVNKANEGDWIITNTTGEVYIRPEKDIVERYDPTNEEGVYAAKGHCRAIINPFGRPIEIIASWGSLQNGDERCLIADTCDASGKVDGEPYLIDAAAFAKTYKPVESQK